MATIIWMTIYFPLFYGFITAIESSAWQVFGWLAIARHAKTKSRGWWIRHCKSRLGGKSSKSDGRLKCNCIYNMVSSGVFDGGYKSMVPFYNLIWWQQFYGELYVFYLMATIWWNLYVFISCGNEHIFHCVTSSEKQEVLKFSEKQTVLRLSENRKFMM